MKGSSAYAQARKPLAKEHSVLLGVSDAGLARHLANAVEAIAGPGSSVLIPSLGALRARLARSSPKLIVLEESFFEGAPLAETLEGLTEFAPLILIASPELQVEVARFVATGDMDFIAQVGKFIPLAASLVERRLRWAERSEATRTSPWGEPPQDLAEIFRHEINNPLTGILGNAELLLAHRDRLPPVDTQRLQTVVDLAVRLRETVRRLSDAWEARSQTLKSA